ncbi:MAG: diphosphate--fructose-6-phosphate 1-phosphotransferase [Deltaproteobacteria bacterium]|nr:MAG: diphosphate--fructose-6-phosphate 1-phosphotransferase [Deltaproteobacteria bacterium]
MILPDHLPTQISTIGTPRITSPLSTQEPASSRQPFIPETERVLIDAHPGRLMERLDAGKPLLSFETAGPREYIYFDPSKLNCALVTCGGLCPGLNDIIRSVVLELYFRYGVTHIHGIRYGLQGFIPAFGHEPLSLTPETVVDILNRGGSILGSSRGAQDMGAIVDCLERMHIGILFMIGGDGTLKAASRIADEIQARHLKISVIGIPKTIDNDIHLVSRSFGFDTAVDVATQAIRAAHNEAVGYPNGIGLIKLMGRHSGFLAATAALAQQDVNFVLIPEVPFTLDGANGLLPALEKRLAHRHHAVIVVAEGAGQTFLEQNDRVDASGNARLGDIGVYLKQRITDYLSEKGIEHAVKYIDPSYIIRSLPANANDHVFCSFLGRHAVHAGMAGKTRMLVGHWNDQYVHLPMEASVGKRKHVDPDGSLWHAVCEATGQEAMI